MATHGQHSLSPTNKQVKQPFKSEQIPTQREHQIASQSEVHTCFIDQHGKPSSSGLLPRHVTMSGSLPAIGERDNINNTGTSTRFIQL